MSKTKIMALTMLGGLVCASSAFAADNNYGIVYSGGADLGSSNLTIDEELINGLTPLIKSSQVVTTPNESTRWVKNAYLKDTPYCRQYSYFEVPSNGSINENDGLGFTIENDQYFIDVVIKSVKTEQLPGDRPVTVGISPNIGGVYGGWLPYTDEECTVAKTGIDNISVETGGRIFVETLVKLYKKDNTKKVFTSDQLYFGITDIDAAQSYKILNPTNLLTKDNMFAKSAAALQPSEDINLRNKYVANGNYIYSEYNTESEPHRIIIDRDSNIFVKINNQVQEDGLDIVFGFAGSAASGIQYYAKQFMVQYKSDEYGQITGIEDETIIAGKNPSSSDQKPTEGYVISNWVANVDVVLADGATIKAGESLTDTQIKTVIVNQDIIFTAIHAPAQPDVPNTGASTKNIEPATVVSASVIGTLICALMIRALPRITRRKVKFDN